jgi:hypothetical protein
MVLEARRGPREARGGHLRADGEEVGRCFGKLTHIQPDAELLSQFRQNSTQFVNLLRG